MKVAQTDLPAWMKEIESIHQELMWAVREYNQAKASHQDVSRVRRKMHDLKQKRREMYVSFPQFLPQTSASMETF